MTHRPAVGLFAKPVVPGTVKTRLIPPLDGDLAAALYAAFLTDLARMLDAQTRADWLVFSTEPEAQRATWPAVAPVPARWEPQTGLDLGARMDAALRLLLERGHPAAMLVGSDHPTLPAERLDQAWDALGASDVVLGPTPDGGYYLVAVAAPHPALFRDVPWSTPDVLPVTRERIAEAGLRAAYLEPWDDVDTLEDLHRVGEWLAAQPTGADDPAAATRAAIEALPPTRDPFRP